MFLMTRARFLGIAFLILLDLDASHASLARVAAQPARNDEILRLLILPFLGQVAWELDKLVSKGHSVSLCFTISGH